MRLYDLIVILRPNLTEAKKKQAVESVKGLFKDVKVTAEEDWGQKVFAYPIKKEQAGVYVKMSLESAIGVAKDFETKLIQNENVLRHLLVRTK